MYNKDLFKFSTDTKIGVNFVVLTNDLRISIAEVLKYFEPECVIIDSSNSVLKKNIWIDECKEYGVNYYSIHDSGAFRYNL